MSLKPHIESLARLIHAGKVTFFSGAGMSTASGLPDFRSAENGLWGKIDPMKVASSRCLEKNYDQFHAFYKMRLNQLVGIEPNAGHHFISRMEKAGKVVGVITQNVDGLHEAAGSVNIATLHGRLREIRCEHCTSPSTIPAFENGSSCEKCGGHLRPGVVLFGESLPSEALRLADTWTNSCQTFIVLGSSLRVSPANSFPEIAKRRGANLVIINAEPTECDSMADLVIHDPIVEVFEETEKAMKLLE
ncbi:NAD-dependent protein deacetylase [Tritrichomonas foetus]|uniref:NAD-dependent protein deacetylase n=1 Tax=Tritrichomonas foetus TaxID=1144522 RepID=A0A1J4JX94_9EUKA|nr:NAD-dependent protein deacetylase [Tritrichomonas foetus]|eukprot:OHT02158.1 NAD-dependent protein deacetylase [Tritrichomonas foetus]